MLMMLTLTCWRGLLLIASSIDSADLEIISMHKEGDGAQKLELFKHPEEKVLQELMSDIRLAGCQHFAFKEYLDPHGNRLCWSCKWIRLFLTGSVTYIQGKGSSVSSNLHRRNVHQERNPNSSNLP